MHMTILCRSLALLAVLLGQCGVIAPVLAQVVEPGARVMTSNGLDIETIAERRIVTPSADGAQIEFVPTGQLHIGDEIFYTVRVRNATDNDIDPVLVVKAIPHNTRLVADSVVGPATIVGFSIDGGSSFDAPDALSIATAPGIARRATSDDYTHIRWEMRHPLAAGATALLRFRGIFK